MRILTVYSALPVGRSAPGGDNFPDYVAIINRFEGQRMVKELGVKEFWLFGYHTSALVPAESKMSSALTGDISNSCRFNDMPVCRKSYVLYNYNYTRTAAEAVHNHGYQLESILGFIANEQDGNSDLFFGSSSSPGMGSETVK